MRDQIHKDSHPDMGCSGSLNPTETVHPVNVGTSCFGLLTGLAVVDVKHEARRIHSSRSQRKSDTWRRNLANQRFKGSREVRGSD